MAFFVRIRNLGPGSVVALPNGRAGTARTLCDKSANTGAGGSLPDGAGARACRMPRTAAAGRSAGRQVLAVCNGRARRAVPSKRAGELCLYGPAAGHMLPLGGLLHGFGGDASCGRVFSVPPAFASYCGRRTGVGTARIRVLQFRLQFRAADGPIRIPCAFEERCTK